MGFDGVYSNYISSPPEGATVAQGTTIQCGKWHVAAGDDTCSSIAFSSGTTIGVFMEVNLSLGTVVVSCTGHLVQGIAYCALPFVAWDQL